MFTGIEGGSKEVAVELHLRRFRALGTRVAASAIRFVANVLELTVGVATDTAVQVATDGWQLELLAGHRLGWGGGNGLRQVGSSGGKGGGVGTKGLGRFRSKRACQGAVTVHVVVDTAKEGLHL